MNRSVPRARIVVRTADARLRALIRQRLADLGDVVAGRDGEASRVGYGSGAVVDVANEDAGGAGITARELEVLGLCADGLANKQIAQRLGVTPHTAKFHVESLLKKLGAPNRAGAVKEGIRRGLIAV
jgi:DNA-binding CsgD family transcriptional regulator